MVLRIRPQPNLLFIFLLFATSTLYAEEINEKFSFNKERNKYHISTSVAFQSSSITSESSSTSIASDSEFTLIAENISGQYFINSMFALSGSYFFALVLDIDAEVQGFDIGVEYFYFNNGASKDIDISGSNLQTSPELSPYLYFGASTRDIQFSTVNLKFQGIQVKAGTYWHFGDDDLYLKGNVFMDKQYNNNVREISSFGATLGIGKSF